MLQYLIACIVGGAHLQENPSLQGFEYSGKDVVDEQSKYQDFSR